MDIIKKYRKKYRFEGMAAFILIMLLGVFLVACGDDSKSTANSGNQNGNSKTLSLDLELPDSITGGLVSNVTNQESRLVVQAGTGMPCAYMGPEDDDPFRNGYEMTKFMVSAVATWTCLADTLIEVADSVPHDGLIHPTDNDKSKPDYDSDDPTHYRVDDDSETQTTIRLYYGYDRTTPPTLDDDPQFFLSWNESEAGVVEGRLIIDGETINEENRNPDDPVIMRMDFNFDDTQEIVDMFLRFDENNLWAEGFRIQVTKDLTAGPLEQVFTALGLIQMKAQFIPVNGITEIPAVHMFTVSDAFGNGAALAEFQQLSLPLELNAKLGNHLGNYLFDKDDIYFFEDDMDWNWVAKSITDSSFRGGRTTPATGGSWIPFDPSLDMIITALELDADYFTGSKCAEMDDDCTDLLNAVFIDGFAGQEPNQGSDPMDWRSEAIDDPTYIDSVYPNGVDWSGAFDYIYMP
jgi:hypothetical protein